MNEHKIVFSVEIDGLKTYTSSAFVRSNKIKNHIEITQNDIRSSILFVFNEIKKTGSVDELKKRIEENRNMLLRSCIKH